ncbi:MAG: hypothetical protein QOF18_2378 [Frankiaceae bacterium]|nr:hypothetical protein [Frankiaceae bacterium]
MALAAVPLAAVMLVDAAVLIQRATKSDAPKPAASASAHPRTTSSAQAERRTSIARAAAISSLLARRGHAVMHHDKAEWMSTVDPAQRRFRRSQRAVFANLQQVPFASWSYTFEPDQPQIPDRQSQRYGVPSWAPSQFALHYRLRGFDPKPTNLAQFPTFVHRASGWFLASLSDFANEGAKSSLDLWDFGPVAVLRTPSVLVLGHPGGVISMQSLADEVAADIPRVTAVWGRHWARRVVVLAPATQRELGRVVGDFGALGHIAAVATAEVNIGSGKPDPVGDRVGINPNNWSKLSSLGREIVLTHELTHVATRAVTSAATPTWLAEGFADYVGYLGSGVPTTFVAQELRTDVLGGRVPKTLPPDSQFDGASKSLSQAYESAWMACRLIAQKWGQPTLVRFYNAVGRSHENPRIAVANATERVLHLSATAFFAQWRAFLRTELA